MKKFVLLILLTSLSLLSFSQDIMIFGGEDHDVFLGYLNTDEYDPKSIWSQYGDYGNSFSSKSIWNEFGNYGNEFSSYSPFNEYALYPPVLVDHEGNFYGYFTANEYHDKRTRVKSALFILKNFELIREDTSKFYNVIFD